MGKAARELKNNLKQIYDDENVSDSEDSSSDEYTDEKDIEYEITKTAYLIQTELFDYVKNEAYPLCEFLSIKGIENYIKFLLSQSHERS